MRGALLERAGDHRALERDRLGDARGQPGALLGRGAQRRHAPGEQAAGRPLRLEQRTQREQVIAETLVGALALAAELKAPQRPGELVGARRAARDEVAEGPQLVLLLGGHDEHAVRPSACAEGDRSPAPVLTAAAHPGELAEHDTPIAEQTQRAQQVLEQLATARDRGGFAVIAGGGRAVVVHAEAERQLLRGALALLERERNEQMLRVAFITGARRLRRIARRVGRGDRQALGERDLARGDRHAVQRRDHRHRVARACDLGAPEALDAGAHALARKLEVAASLEHVVQQLAQRGARPRLSRRPRSRGRALAHVARDDPRRGADAAACQVAIEALQPLQGADGRSVLGQQQQLCLALGDERVGQRLIAIERRLCACASAVRGQLEGHLSALREL